MCNFIQLLKEKFGYKKLPIMNGDEYLYKEKENTYKLENKFEVDICDAENSIEELYVYGWVIEFRANHNGKWGSWYIYYNNKIYRTQQDSVDAINQINNHGLWREYEFRVKPLYNFKKNGYRTYIINKIIKEEE